MMFKLSIEAASSVEESTKIDNCIDEEEDEERVRKARLRKVKQAKWLIRKRKKEQGKPERPREAVTIGRVEILGFFLYVRISRRERSSYKEHTEDA